MSSGANTPESQLESVLPVHPTAVRRASSIVVQSEHTSYTNDHIISKFTNRGADVTIVEGQYIVTPTAKPYEFQTARKVSKTGYVFFRFVTCLPYTSYPCRAMSSSLTIFIES